MTDADYILLTNDRLRHLYVEACEADRRGDRVKARTLDEALEEGLEKEILALRAGPRELRGTR